MNLIYIVLIAIGCLILLILFGLAVVNKSGEEVLDSFIETMLKIAKEIEENPEEVLKSPQTTPIRKVDETLAARQPNLTFKG